MEVVIDSVTMNHFIRCPSRKKSLLSTTSLDNFILKKRLIIGIDHERVLIDEWVRTCGPEAIKTVIVRWSDYGGVRLVKKSNIHYHIKKRLRILGFCDAIDIVVLQIAIALGDKIIISNDPDFWDPRNRRNIGNAQAPVARLCKQHWNVKILLPDELMQKLDSDRCH